MFGRLARGKLVESVVGGTLPARDEQLSRLERWTAQVIAGRRAGPHPARPRAPILPEPLDTLVLQPAATRRGHQGTSPWLLPGGQPGRPISAEQLTERLRQLGIRSGQSRSAALFQLATDLPAAVLARLLGIHITVAVAWQRASAGDWSAYAAEVSRRARKDDNQ